MNLEKQKPKSSFERVVGNIPESKKEKILQERRERFDNQIFEKLKGKEREKTPEELQIIALANDMTNEIRRRYGLSDFDIPPQNIHVIKKEQWPDKESPAFYDSMLQGVATKESSERIVFMAIVLHEMLHFKSYNALQVTKDEKAGLEYYRIGLTVTARDGKDRYFTSLNEAVTEEITKRFILKNYLKFFDNPLFSQEIKRAQVIQARVREKSNDSIFIEDTYHATVKEKKSLSNVFARIFDTATDVTITTYNFTYKQERKNLNVLIDKIFERNPEQFKDKEEVFELFARSMMTGNILPIGKLIDNTFGRGTFDKFSELDKNKQGVAEQEKFIETL